ncbi:MAG: histidine kinase dimerization/phospho-acceptor domain-containing protein [Caldilineaceae bacterium]
MAIIKGYAQTLARPDAAWDPEIARQGLEIIEEEADRLEALINDLLDVSRIQAGGLRLEITDVSLYRLLMRLAQDYRTQTTAHQIAVDLPEDFVVSATKTGCASSLHQSAEQRHQVFARRWHDSHRAGSKMIRTFGRWATACGDLRRR